MTNNQNKRIVFELQTLLVNDIFEDTSTSPSRPAAQVRMTVDVPATEFAVGQEIARIRCKDSSLQGILVDGEEPQDGQFRREGDELVLVYHRSSDTKVITVEVDWVAPIDTSKKYPNALGSISLPRMDVAVRKTCVNCILEIPLKSSAIFRSDEKKHKRLSHSTSFFGETKHVVGFRSADNEADLVLYPEKSPAKKRSWAWLALLLYSLLVTGLLLGDVNKTSMFSDKDILQNRTRSLENELEHISNERDAWERQATKMQHEWQHVHGRADRTLADSLLSSYEALQGADTNDKVLNLLGKMRSWEVPNEEKNQFKRAVKFW